MRRFATSSGSLEHQSGSGSGMMSFKSGHMYEPLSATHKRVVTKQILVKVIAVLMVGVVGAFGLRSSLSPANPVYGLMIDAGSTGSRMHTFQFTRDGAGKLSLVTEDFLAIKPGLSAYKDDPGSAAASLEPLLVRARSIIPESDHARTPVFLRATAGLRMTGEEAAAAILKTVHETLRGSGFRFDSPTWATILDGSDEGIYSWITVNSLLDRPPGNTVGTLEMGGGSAQIAFVPTDGSGTATNNCSTPSDPTVYRAKSLPLYTFSNLKFGLKMGRSVALNYFKDNSLLSENPCLNKGGDNGGLEVPIPFNEQEEKVTMSGAGNFDACRALVDKAVTKPAYATCGCDACTYHGLSAPKPISEYYAFAFYLERTVALGMSTPLTVVDIRKKGEEVCAMSVVEVKKAFPGIPNGDATDVCLDLAFMASHLAWGHGITENTGTKLHVVDKIKGVELGWSLGAMMAELGRLGLGQ
jgi:Golgi nucleoside diphosphatase